MRFREGDRVRIVDPISETEAVEMRRQDRDGRVWRFLRYSNSPSGYAVVADEVGSPWHFHPEALELVT